MAKTPAQLDAEIARALSGHMNEYVPGTSWGAAGARPQPQPQPRARPAKRVPKMTITDTNLYALTELVLANGGRRSFGNRLAPTDRPHIKRTLTAGLIQVTNPTTLRLTDEGAEIVLRRLRLELARATETVALQRSRGPSYAREEARALERERQLDAAIQTLSREV